MPENKSLVKSSEDLSLNVDRFTSPLGIIVDNSIL